MTTHPTHVTPRPQTAADVVQQPHALLDGTTPALTVQRRRRPDGSWEYLTLWAEGGEGGWSASIAWLPADRLRPYVAGMKA